MQLLEHVKQVDNYRTPPGSFVPCARSVRVGAINLSLSCRVISTDGDRKGESVGPASCVLTGKLAVPVPEAAAAGQKEEEEEEHQRYSAN